MNLRLALVAMVVMVFGAFGSHRAQTVLDPLRRERSAELELLVMPSADTLRPASMGQSRLVADILWLRAVLAFGERFDKNPSEEWRVWFDRMLVAVAGLDPGWRTVYFYGGTMLRINGGQKQSTRLFLQGAEERPDDSYLHFSAGMTIYLAGGDPQAAARHVERAAEAGGPAWYRDLATHLLAEGAGNNGAREFLVEELRHTEDPGQRAVLEQQIQSLDYQEFSRRLTQLLTRHLEAGGQAVQHPDDLVRFGLLRELPPVPTGGSWVIDPKGPKVVGNAAYEQAVSKDQKAGRRMLGWKAKFHK